MSDAGVERSPAAASHAPLNHLALEPSPYLRAHAHNPVDWYPWGPEALARARSEGKPILLSVGYAACHWCHVMAHESFEDAATAALMNERFVNIKVDREERPDLDRIYQLAQQLLTGRSGGWPLTAFLMHDDQRPFFAGTYFPPEARFGLPGFRELLVRVSDFYCTHQQELRAPAARLVEALAALAAPPAHDAPPDASPIKACRARLERGFDARWGGFGAAPKFPHVPGLERLLRDWRASAHSAAPDLQALYMATLTLTRMGEGGLFDQLGGGFYRYSVDERWEIPHFEKMLYDNAQLLALYAEAALATGEPLFHEIAERTGRWLLGELCAPQGAFWSSLDADSEGHEGTYYLWSEAQLREALPADQWPLVAARFGLHGTPNFEGRWHLRVHQSIGQIAAGHELSQQQVRDALAAAGARLAEQRSLRTRPALDDKILTGWNALAIRGFAVAARSLGRDDFCAAATAALRYLHAVHWRDGRLFAASTGGQGRLDAYLDDYAFLLEALLELATVRCRAEELQWARELAEVLLRHYQDPGSGGFFFTADDHEALISRTLSFADESVPAGSACAARALLRLGALLGETRYLEAAERALRCAWSALIEQPEAHASMVTALEEYLEPPELVLLRGPAAMIEPWQTQLNAVYAPRRWTVAVPAELQNLPEAIANKPAPARPVAYVCRGLQCSTPIDSLAVLLHELGHH